MDDYQIYLITAKNHTFSLNLGLSNCYGYLGKQGYCDEKGYPLDFEDISINLTDNEYNIYFPKYIKGNNGKKYKLCLIEVE